MIAFVWGEEGKGEGEETIITTTVFAKSQHNIVPRSPRKMHVNGFFVDPISLFYIYN